MPICNPTDLRTSGAHGRPLLALDVGDKRIGTALSDPMWVVASPVGTITRGRRFAPVAEAVEAIVTERNVGALVLGLPVNMDGNEGPRCQSVRQFAENLLSKRDYLITFWDERLSTQAVERMMIEADMTRRKRGQTVDQAAAAWILQGLLDFSSRQTG